MSRVMIVFSLGLALAACKNSGSADVGQGSGHALGQRTLHVRNIDAPEGSAAAPGEARFDVLLSSPATHRINVNYETLADTAQAGPDFKASAGTLSFAPGETSRTIGVALVGDNVDEPGEHFRLRLSAPSGASLGKAEALAGVANDDMPCTLPRSANPWLDRKPIGFAHRGGVAEFPENTLYAYQKSRALGLDVLEMDVYQTTDGELVILHDLTVNRTTDGSGDVGNFTLAQLQQLDAAYWFVEGEGTPHERADAAYTFRGVATGQRPPPPGYRAEDFRIPTLEEALQALPGALINIELKPDVDGLGNYEAKVAELLKRYGRSDNVMVASFLDPPAALFKLQAPCVSTSVPTVQVAALVLSSQGPLPMLPPAVHHAFQVPPDTSQISQIPEALRLDIVSDDFIADAHAAGLAVHVWTIDDCPTMVALLRQGVDGLMSDRPALLKRVLEQPVGEWTCEGLE